MYKLLWILLLTPTLTLAADWKDQIEACAEVQKNDDRLVCYDRLSGTPLPGKSDKLIGEYVTLLTPFLKPWEPTRIEAKKGTLMIALPQDIVSEQIFLSVVKSGVCGSVRLGAERWGKIKKIEVLNRYARQGYVFKGGYTDCGELGRLSENESNVKLLEMTHLKRDRHQFRGR